MRLSSKLDSHRVSLGVVNWALTARDCALRIFVYMFEYETTRNRRMPSPTAPLKSDPLGQLASGLASRLAQEGHRFPRHSSGAARDAGRRRRGVAHCAPLSPAALANVADSLMAGRAPARGRALALDGRSRRDHGMLPALCGDADRQRQVGRCDQTAGGHRKVPLASVEAWIASRESPADPDYREAGKAAGIYGVGEAVFMKAALRKPIRARGSPSVVAGGRPVGMTLPAGTPAPSASGASLVQLGKLRLRRMRRCQRRSLTDGTAGECQASFNEK